MHLRCPGDHKTSPVHACDYYSPPQPRLGGARGPACAHQGGQTLIPARRAPRCLERKVSTFFLLTAERVGSEARRGSTQTARVTERGCGGLHRPRSCALSLVPPGACQSTIKKESAICTVGQAGGLLFLVALHSAPLWWGAGVRVMGGAGVGPARVRVRHSLDQNCAPARVITAASQACAVGW